MASNYQISGLQQKLLEQTNRSIELEHENQQIKAKSASLENHLSQLQDVKGENAMLQAGTAQLRDQVAAMERILKRIDDKSEDIPLSVIANKDTEILRLQRLLKGETERAEKQAATAAVFRRAYESARKEKIRAVEELEKVESARDRFKNASKNKGEKLKKLEGKKATSSNIKGQYGAVNAKAMSNLKWPQSAGFGYPTPPFDPKTSMGSGYASGAHPGDPPSKTAAYVNKTQDKDDEEIIQIKDEPGLEEQAVQDAGDDSGDDGPIAHSSQLGWFYRQSVPSSGFAATKDWAMDE